MQTANQNTATVTFSIDGMSCGHCVQAVTRAISTVPGVRVRSVSLGSAVIEGGDAAAIAGIIAALDDAGYAARPTLADAGAPAKSAGCCGGAKRHAGGVSSSAETSGGCCS